MQGLRSTRLIKNQVKRHDDDHELRGKLLFCKSESFIRENN